MRELPVPLEVREAATAQEIFRAWQVREDVIFSVSASPFSDVGSYGIVLADLLRNIIATCGGNKSEQGDRLRRAVDVFNIEFENEA